jgi:hypothetical protein
MLNPATGNLLIEGCALKENARCHERICNILLCKHKLKNRKIHHLIGVFKTTIKTRVMSLSMYLFECSHENFLCGAETETLADSLSGTN